MVFLSQSIFHLPRLLALDGSRIIWAKSPGSRGVLDRSLEDTKPTCYQCGTVCSGPLEDRKRLMNLLFTSGVVEQDEQGKEIVIRRDEKGPRVVIRPEERLAQGQAA